MENYINNIEYVIGHCDSQDIENIQEYIKFNLEKISNEMRKMYTTTCVIVLIRSNINVIHAHIYTSFLEANELINAEAGVLHHSIEIYQYDCIHNQFTFVMDKLYDSCDFNRPREIKNKKLFDEIFIKRIVNIFDTSEIKITLHCPMKL